MKHRGMIHIHLKVSDLERSIRFYEQAASFILSVRTITMYIARSGKAISRCHPGAIPQRKHCTGSPVCRPRSAAVGLFARPDGLVPYHGRLRSP